ncbi:hypothetical protein DdX_04937 [Ditylenchus destructor]|uniref:Uncharacterized protein n=1 Tax=Ditylenchus destructor TaxID=166010 RepID=A0AAD4NDF2_9BILA|nr:hypothetical protein DdX_04937 [Ditylenchus destructor]
MTSNLLDANIDELLGGNDTDIVLGDDIDVDAILGTSDEPMISNVKEKDQREEPSTTTSKNPEENSYRLAENQKKETRNKYPHNEFMWIQIEEELGLRLRIEVEAVLFMERNITLIPIFEDHCHHFYKFGDNFFCFVMSVRENFSATISANLTNFPVRPFTAPPPMVPALLPPFVRPFTSRPLMNVSLMPPPVVHQAPGMASNITSDAMNWSLMVDAFLAKTKSDAQPKQVRSRPSRYSRSSSSGSRSKSRTPNSSSSSSPYSARSPIPSYSRRSKKVARYDRSPVRRAYDQRRKHSGSRRDENKSKPDMKHTIECAQAIGLDEEYLKKIEEQKKMREEIAKRKSQRRQENYNQKKEGNEGRRQIAMNRDSKSGKSNKTSSNNRPKREDKQEQLKPDVASAQSTMGKLKAYLAVVINNINSLENAYKKISLLAQSVGETKKVWQSSENSVSIIFDKHEHAKQFMLQYHGQIVHGCKLDVTLEKVFLNLATMS